MTDRAKELIAAGFRTDEPGRVMKHKFTAMDFDGETRDFGEVIEVTGEVWDEMDEVERDYEEVELRNAGVI